jgi:hypothetical protein
LVNRNHTAASSAAVPSQDGRLALPDPPSAPELSLDTPSAEFWRELRDYYRADWRWWLLVVRVHRSCRGPGPRLGELLSYARHSHRKGLMAARQLRKAGEA